MGLKSLNLKKASVFEALAQEPSPQGRRRLAGRSRVRDSQDSECERCSIGESYGFSQIDSCLGMDKYRIVSSGLHLNKN